MVLGRSSTSRGFFAGVCSLCSQGTRGPPHGRRAAKAAGRAQSGVSYTPKRKQEVCFRGQGCLNKGKQEPGFYFWLLSRRDLGRVLERRGMEERARSSVPR